MKRIVLFSVIPTLILAACHKDKKPLPDKPEPIVKQYSYWRVNEDSFSTNQVFINVYQSPGNAVTVIEGGNQANSFDISFSHLINLPASGNFPLADSSMHYYTGEVVGIDFRYKGGYYFLARPTDNDLSATSVNGKAQYTLPPTWFYSYYHPEDSVLISGTFNEP